MGWADGGAEVAVAVAILPGASGEVIPGGGTGDGVPCCLCVGM